MDAPEVVDLRPARQSQEFEPFTPILDRVLLRAKPRNESADGFAIPEKYREPEAWGTVVAIGDGVVLGGEWWPLDRFLNVGDEVRYGEHSAEKYEVLGDPDFPDGDYYIVRIQDLRGVRRVKRG